MMKEIFGTWADFRKYTADLQVHCLFRGHSSADFLLMPSIGRAHPKYLPNAMVEEDLLSQFKLRALPFLKTKPSNDLEWLIIGRHYGLKTRLLDWTQSPYVALYFALQHSAKNDALPCSIIIAKQPEIIGYNEICNNHRAVDTLTFFEPPHLDMRIANQEAFLSLNENPFEALDGTQFVQFNFYPFETARLEEILFDVGIRHSTIYPDLGGVCSHLNDNPSFVSPSLEVANLSWKSVPNTLIGKTVEEIENGLLTQRSIWYLLQMQDASSLIGIPLECADGHPGKLRAVYSYPPRVSILREDGHRTLVDNDERSLQDYKVDGAAVKNLFPNGIFMRTKRPLP